MWRNYPEVVASLRPPWTTWALRVSGIRLTLFTVAEGRKNESDTNSPNHTSPLAAPLARPCIAPKLTIQPGRTTSNASSSVDETSGKFRKERRRQTYTDKDGKATTDMRKTNMFEACQE